MVGKGGNEKWGEWLAAICLWGKFWRWISPEWASGRWPNKPGFVVRVKKELSGVTVRFSFLPEPQG